MRRIMVVFGTRPEAIKLAPLLHELGRSPWFEPWTVVTGQHRSMLDQVLELFALTPDHDLDLIEDRQTLTGLTVRALERLSALVVERRPDAVLVQGDTTSTLAGALAAFYHHVPVVHLEAGLRTGDRESPFPEEANRRLTTQLTSLHLAPTTGSRRNLEAEGVAPEHVVVTGNTVIDALQWARDRHCDYGERALEGLDADPRRVLLVTAHRRESWASGLDAVGRALAELARSEPDLLTVVPIHRNPVVREALLPWVAELPSVVVVEPLPYGAFCRLMDRAHLVLTDSGGVQEEAPGLGKPVLVLRDSTERPEAVAAGTVKLVGTEQVVVVEEVRRLLHDPVAYEGMANAVNPYGDGRAARRAHQALGHLFGECARPDEFQ